MRAIIDAGQVVASLGVAYPRPFGGEDIDDPNTAKVIVPQGHDDRRAMTSRSSRPVSRK
jgi:hypothetical protein